MNLFSRKVTNIRDKTSLSSLALETGLTRLTPPPKKKTLNNSSKVKRYRTICEKKQQMVEAFGDIKSFISYHKYEIK